MTPVAIVGKSLRIGSRRFFALLRNDKIFDRENLPYQKHIDAGYFKVVRHEHSYPGSCNKGYSFTPKVTNKGIEWLNVKYKGMV